MRRHRRLKAKLRRVQREDRLRVTVAVSTANEGKPDIGARWGPCQQVWRFQASLSLTKQPLRSQSQEDFLEEAQGVQWEVGDALETASSGQGEAEFDPGLRDRPAGLLGGLTGCCLGPRLAEPLPRTGARPDPAQAAARSPGLGAAGGADWAERSAAGGGVGGGGWSREVRRVCGALLYLLLRSPAAAAAVRPSVSGAGSEFQRAARRRRQPASMSGVKKQKTVGSRSPAFLLPAYRVAPTLPGH